MISYGDWTLHPLVIYTSYFTNYATRKDKRKYESKLSMMINNVSSKNVNKWKMLFFKNSNITFCVAKPNLEPLISEFESKVYNSG